MALRVFKSARAVLEASRGAGGTPTRIIEFTEGTHTPTVDTIRPEEYRGSYFGHYGAAKGTERNEFRFSGDLSFEHAVWLGLTFISGTTTSAGVGTGGYQWAFTPSGTANNLKSAYIEYGYSDGIATAPAIGISSVVGEELTIKWDKAGSRISWDARMTSPLAASDKTSFTGSPTAPTVSMCSTSSTQAYANGTAAAFGGTADNNILDVEWNLKNGWANLYTLNNSTAAQLTDRPALLAWTAKIRRYYADNTMRAAYQAKTLQRVRVLTTGAAMGTATYMIQLDLCGRLTARTEAEVDGLGIEEYTLEPEYDSTLSADYKFIVNSAESTCT